MPVATLSGLAARVSEELYERYRALVSLGPAPALVEGSTVDAWVLRLLGAGSPLGDLRVSTPFLFIKRELELWWPAVEARLPPGLARDPLFVDVDLAQGLMDRFSAASRIRLGDFDGARTPPHLRMVHLLDSLGRALENEIALSEVGDRLVGGTAHLDEQALLAQVQPCLEAYVQGMISHRLLDQGLAWHVYATCLLTDPGYRASLASLPGVVVEALDEATPLFQRILREFSAIGVAVVVGLREDGGLREFLGADPAGAWEWAGTEDSTEPPVSVPRVLRAIGDRLVRVESPTWPAMVKEAASQAIQLAGSLGAKELAIVVPAVSPLLVSWLRSHLAGAGLRMVVTSGGNRLSDHWAVRVLLTLGRAAIGRPLDREAWLEVLGAAIGGDPLELAVHADRLATGEWPASPEGGFARLSEWWAGEKPSALETFFRAAFAIVVAAELPRDASLGGVTGSVAKLVSAAARFGEVADRLGDDAGFPARMAGFLAWVDAGTIAEGFVRPDPDEEVVVLATASQYAQQGRAVEAQIWVDCDAPAWWKSDARELTNPQVLSVRWDGRPYGQPEDAADQERKLARVLFACAARCRGRIHAHASPLGADGNEQTGGLG